MWVGLHLKRKKLGLICCSNLVILGLIHFIFEEISNINREHVNIFDQLNVFLYCLRLWMWHGPGFFCSCDIFVWCGMSIYFSYNIWFSVTVFHIGFHNEVSIFDLLYNLIPYFWFAAEDDGLFNDPFENSLDWCCFLLFSQTELCWCCCCCCLWSCWSSTSSRPLQFDRRE